MKKSTIIIALIILVIQSQTVAQNYYFQFRVNGKYGITDTSTLEIIKPAYEYLTENPDNVTLLQNFDNSKDVMINMHTGKKALHEHIQSKRIFVNEVPYYLIGDKEKAQLLCEKNGQVIQLKEDYHEMNNEGRYIIGKYYPHYKPEPVSVSKVKRGAKDKLMPPPIIDMQLNGLTVFTNNDPMSVVFDGDYSDYMVLYKSEEEKESEEADASDKIVRIQEMNISRKEPRESPDFFVLLLRKYHTHSAFSYDLKLIDTFNSEDYEKEKLVAQASEILKTQVSEYDFRNRDEISIMAAPVMAASTEKYPDPVNTREYVKPATIYPELGSEKMKNGYTQVFVRQSDSIKKVLFRTQKTVSINDDNTVRFFSSNDKDSGFSIDIVKAKVLLPKKYWTILGMLAN